MKIIASLIIRRVFFLPSLLDVYYFDFFQDNPIYYSHSFFTSIFNYPYFQSPKSLISINYFNDFNMNANNGLISDGYMNLGVVGILLNLILFSCIMTFIKSLNISMKFYGIVFLFIFSVLSSPLSTIMVTHGGFILLIILNFTIKIRMQINKIVHLTTVHTRNDPRIFYKQSYSLAQKKKTNYISL